MSQTLENSNNAGGKTSIKDKLSRRVRLTITKTGQKLKTSQKCISGSDYERLQDYHNKVRNQKEALRKLNDQWKRYLAKTEEIDKICYEFETDLVRFCNLYEKTNENIKKSTLHFPVINGVPFAAEIMESKSHLEKESKKIKTAEEHYSVYLASKNIFQKATEMKKEREKQAMETAHMTFSEDIQNLDQTLPHAIEMSRERLYRCMATYFDEKIQHLNMVLEANKNIQELIKDFGDLSSSPLSSSVPGSPGCSTAAAVDEQTSLPTNEYSEPSDKKNIQGRSEFSPHQPTSSKASPKRTHSVSNSRNSQPAVLTQSETSPASTSEHTTGNMQNDSESSENTTSNLTSRTPPFDVIAAYPYTSEEQDELQFEADELVTVLPWSEPEDEEVGWLYGRRKKTGQKGLFPANYVRLVTL